MFICDKCKRVTEPKEKPVLVISEKRDKIYQHKNGNSRGWEVAKEIRICEPCNNGSKK